MENMFIDKEKEGPFKNFQTYFEGEKLRFNFCLCYTYENTLEVTCWSTAIKKQYLPKVFGQFGLLIKIISAGNLSGHMTCN